MTTEDQRPIIEPYLFFKGNCEEALEYYKKAIGAEVTFLMRFKESPEPPPPGQVPPGYEDKIMHASFKVGESTVMASDGCSDDKTPFHGFSLSLAVKDEGQATRAFNALSQGGQVQMPLMKTFWSPLFGMLEDKFGVNWMVMVYTK